MGPSHKHPKQLVLFDPGKREGSGNTPSWRSLPSQTQQKAVRLLARLFIEHCRRPVTEVATQTVDPRPEESSDDV